MSSRFLKGGVDIMNGTQFTGTTAITTISNANSIYNLYNLINIQSNIVNNTVSFGTISSDTTLVEIPNTYSGYFVDVSCTYNVSAVFSENVRLFDANTYQNNAPYIRVRNSTSNPSIPTQGRDDVYIILTCPTSQFIYPSGITHSSIGVFKNGFITLQAVNNNWLILDYYSDITKTNPANYDYTKITTYFNVDVTTAGNIQALTSVALTTSSISVTQNGDYTFATNNNGNFVTLTVNRGGVYPNDLKVFLYDANVYSSTSPYLKIWNKSIIGRYPIGFNLECTNSNFIGPLGFNKKTITVPQQHIITLQAINNDWYVLELFQNKTDIQSPNVTPIQINVNANSLTNWYPFDSDVSNYAFGAAVSDITLYNGAAVQTTTKKIGTGSLYLNGSSSQYAKISSQAFNVTSNGLSFSCWFNFSSGGWARLFDFGDGAGNNNILYAPGNAALYVYNGTGVYTATLSGGSKSDNQWHHFACSFTYAPYNSLTSVWNVYIDGTNVFTTNIGLYPTVGQRTNNYIGNSNWGSSDGYATGYIDDFRIYNKVLSTSEVQKLFLFPVNNTFPGTNTLSGINSFSGSNAFSGTISFTAGTLSSSVLYGAIPSTSIPSTVLTSIGNANLPSSITISGDFQSSAISFTSDYRIKENVQCLNNQYTVDQLRPVTYYNILSQKKEIGLIAHEVQEIYPFLVEGTKDDPEKKQSLNYMGLLGVLIHEKQNLTQWKKQTEVLLQELKMNLQELQNKRDPDYVSGSIIE